MFDVTVSDFELPPVLSDAEIEELTLAEAARYESEPAEPVDWEWLSGLPRPYLAVALTGLDRDRLSGSERVELLKLDSRLRSMVDADIYTGIGAVYDAEAELFDGDGLGNPEADAFEQTSAEIGTALALTRRGADHETSVALELRDNPKVMAALADGGIDYRRARVILTHLAGLDDTTQELLVDEILPRAGKLTSGQLNYQLGRLAISLNPQAAALRYQHSVQDRTLWTQTRPEGTTTLCGDHLPTDRAMTAAMHIHNLAQTLKTRNDPRSIDQIKADIYLDLLCGQTPQAPDQAASAQGQANPKPFNKTRVHVTVDLETLTGLAEHPGQFNTSPVIAEITRKTIAANHDGQWTYTVTHNGQPISTGTLNRRPTPALKAHTQAAYPHCVFPGCRMPATQTDLDHRNPWTNHGPTSLPNLAPLCRHHHKLKHNNWTLTRNQDGTHTWTSPLGHHYTTGPDPP